MLAQFLEDLDISTTSFYFKLTDSEVELISVSVDPVCSVSYIIYYRFDM